MHRKHGRWAMQREPVVFCEPAQLSLGEERPEGFAHAVSVPVERPAYERSEDVPMLGGHERRTALGGHHKARVDPRLRMEGISRQLQARGERVPGAPAQGLQGRGSRTRVLQGNLDRKSTRLNSSHANISYAVFCLKKKTHLLSKCLSYQHPT